MNSAQSLGSAMKVAIDASRTATAQANIAEVNAKAAKKSADSVVAVQAAVQINATAVAAAIPTAQAALDQIAVVVPNLTRINLVLIGL